MVVAVDLIDEAVDLVLVICTDVLDVSVYALEAVALAESGRGLQPGTEGMATGIELISGPHKSVTRMPLGPLVHS